ncbi:MAG: hypothetical protein QGI09_08430, partial [Dehalococcoidia bacterium]|nr:hypothetical protein [Dehalococcoidia bacterium]
MRYISSRGDAPALSFDEVLLTGLARDGGLYVPEKWPHFDAAALRDMASLSYVEQVVRLTHPFVGKAIPEAAYADLVVDSYSAFDHDPVPARILELRRKASAKIAACKPANGHGLYSDPLHLGPPARGRRD